MIRTQIQKPIKDYEKYTEAALWCNANEAKIEDKGEHYEVVALPETTLEEARQAKLTELNAAFSEASDKACCLSAAGFVIDANEIANRNIEGLILVLAEGENTVFRAYDNSFHEVTREQIETMRREIVVNSQRLYRQKWQFEADIEVAGSIEELDGMEFSFDEVNDGQTA